MLHQAHHLTCCLQTNFILLPDQEHQHALKYVAALHKLALFYYQRQVQAKTTT